MPSAISPAAAIAITTVLAFFSVSSASAAEGAAPSAADLDLAKAHYRTGELNYQNGKFSDAAKEFEEAYRLTTRPELLYNMGKSYDGAGDMRGALSVYRRFLETVKESPDRPFVERRVEELAVLIARVEIHASVQGAAVFFDGDRIGTTPLPQARFEVNPGPHSVEVSAEGYSTFRKQLTLERAQATRIDANLVSLVKVIRVDTREHVPVYKRWYLWAAVGVVVVAGVVTGTVLGVRAANELHGPSLQLPKVGP